MLIFDQLKKGDPQLRLIATGLMLGMGLLAAGLWYVQVVSAKRYRADVADQSFRIVRVPAIRGKILDRNGTALAENRPSYNINLYLEELRKNFRFEYTNRVLKEYRQAFQGKPSGKVDEALQSQARYRVVSNLAAQVSTLIQQPQVLDEKHFTNHYNKQRSLPFPLVCGLTPRQIAMFAERSRQVPSLSLEAQPIRSYPGKSTAAHLLGYIQRDDSPTDEDEMSFQFRLPDYVGQTGLEWAFDQQLRGTPGVKSVLVNNLQYRQSEEVWTSPEPGQNVVLTIDLQLQKDTERALRTANSEPRGAAVVLDCRNGDVLAMASIPTFDPNLFTQRLPDEEWAKLDDKEMRPLINRATHGAYPPGSIFKIIVSLACLEAGTLDPEEEYKSEGFFRFKGRGHIWKDTAPAGLYNFSKAFYLSSNSYFITNGLRAGFERIAEMGRRFGLGRRTGLSSRLETAGYFPDGMERTKKDGSRWMPGDTANLCIGQGDITVTPLQMAVMTAAVANGGRLLEPRLLERIESQERHDAPAPIRFPPGQVRTDLKLNPTHLALVRNAMLLDVESRDERGNLNGTGRRAAVKDMRVCGKTGTAQVMKGQTVTSYITWFASFAPFDSPRYAVVVMIETESGSGASICAPVAHEIYEALVKWERAAASKARGTVAVAN